MAERAGAPQDPVKLTIYRPRPAPHDSADVRKDQRRRDRPADREPVQPAGAGKRSPYTAEPSADRTPDRRHAHVLPAEPASLRLVSAARGFAFFRIAQNSS